MEVAIGIDVAEACPDGIVNEQKVRIFIPRSFIESQSAVLVDTVWSNFHKGAILRTTSGTSVDPYNGALLVRYVLVLEVPEKEVAVVLFGDFDVPR
jgi:hypothetical protein